VGATHWSRTASPEEHGLAAFKLASAVLKLGFDREVRAMEDVVGIAEVWREREGSSHKAVFRGLVDDIENDISKLSERFTDMDICEYRGFLCMSPD
jgi:hypothetical protein